MARSACRQFICLESAEPTRSCRGGGARIKIRSRRADDCWTLTGRQKLVKKIDFRAALLASALIVSGVSISRAETLDFSYVDSDGNKASWVQPSNPVCPGPGGCSFFPGPISGAIVPVTDGVESFSAGGGDSFTSVGFYVASSDGGFALTVLNTRQPIGNQLFTGTTAAPDFSALLTDSPIVDLYVQGTSMTGTLTVTAGGVPEPSMWVMMVIGFTGLGFAGYRASHKSAAVAA
jgi:hypothetical protein